MDRAARRAVVGRDAELSQLGRLVAGIAAGRGDVCWLQGEPGIGKSALVEVAAVRAAELGCTVFRATANELVTPFPLRLMADCLGVSADSTKPFSAEISELLRGGPGQAGSIDRVLAASERMLELVDRLCADGPVVLAVEDLQWADEPSVLVWNRLARAVDRIPLLLMGSARATPRRAKLDRLREVVRQRGGASLDLGPLDPATAAELAARIAGGAPGAHLRAALGRAGGNPLYLRELVDDLVRRGAVAVSGGEAELHHDVQAIPIPLEGAIENRLRYLPEDTLAALRVAAVMGTEFDAGEWATATGHSVIHVADMVESAAADGVLSGVGDRLRFRHELIRHVLAGQVPAAVRPALHGEIAMKLAQAGHGVDAVARHLQAVPGTLEDWALSWLADVAEPSLYALPRVSAELLERAVEAPWEHDGRWEVLATRLARVLFWMGRDEQASRVATEVAGCTSDNVLSARMRIQIIRSAGRANRPEQALTAVAGPRGDKHLPGLWQARLAAWSALLLHAVGQIIEGAAMAEDSLAMADESGDPLAIASAHHASAMCGGAEERPAHIEAALTALRGQDPESTDLRMMLLANHIVQSADLARRDKAETALTEGLLLAERAGTYRGATILEAGAQFGYRYGRWDDALSHLAVIDRQFPQAKRSSPHHGITAVIALHRGHRAMADAELPEMASAQLEACPACPVYPLTEALALRAEADGDLALAVALMSGWLSAPVGLRPQDRHDSMPYLVHVALEAGEEGTAKAATAMSRADVAVDGSPSRVAAARFCEALINDDVDELEAVAADYENYGWLPMRAFALEEAAVRLAASGDGARARAALTDAARVYTGLEAAWDIRRADTRLRRYGIRRGPHSIRRGPTSGWGALTPAERRIAHLVGQGLSNPDIAAELFLSRRTVQTHVSSILAKLGMSSRVEIVRAAPRPGQASEPGGRSA